VSFEATDAVGHVWYFDVSGTFTSRRGGLQRSETVWKSLGRASALRGRLAPSVPIVFLTTQLPHRPSESDTALRAAGPDAFFDAVDLLSDEGRERLQRYAKGGYSSDPQPGFWTTADLARSKGGLGQLST
jgi:hypothetical protein